MPQQTAMTPERRLAELGIQLPKPAVPVANYVPWVRTGNLLYIAGQIPSREGRPTHTGKLGAGVSVEAGQDAARNATLNGLAVIREAAGGSLDGIARIVKVTGFVACAEGFLDIPKVVNGASDLLVAVFGEQGRHARSAVGVAELPLGVPVEVEFIVELAE
jgi:enamine deaminase RidA (YjgF/YER057c/UK114 family)